MSASGDLTRCFAFYIKRQDLLESTAKLEQDLFAKFYFDYANKFTVQDRAQLFDLAYKYRIGWHKVKFIVH